ncbi:hypothetical protein CLV42_10811 [Chitinophaga ginsengisoli]|uniref:Uncharacterized protein n=1 Tax=Chitinophaga ginsengisoli TaxID=363837 RepID=A0A2P8G286_9BACT|nr:hypothetical protein CLV42_10811 [Chitinophaga ginsengisoli]
MKNSSVIFGVSSLVLGVVGAISTMGHNKFTANARIITKLHNLQCTLFTTTCGNGTGVCTTLTHRTVFTLNSLDCSKVHPKS